jgi:cytoskeletal protein CcmA (bactofilin family)
MWRKPTEDKPASQPSKETAPAQVSTPIVPVAEPPVAAAPPAPEPRVVPIAAPEPMRSPVSGVASRISSGLKITGEVLGDADLVIDGEVHGKVRLTGSRVTIGSGGRVQAEIEAREIIVEGTVQGNLKATESVHLGPASRVSGSVLTPRIGIDDGGRLRGKVETVSAARPRETSTAGSVTRESSELQNVVASAKGE